MKSVLIAALSVAATNAAAQDRVLSFDLGVGVESAPSYFGADDEETDATGTFGLNRLVLGGLSLGGGDANGLGFKFGFRYIEERTADDDAELAGLDDVDESLELGGGLAYTNVPDGRGNNWGSYAFAEVRYGVVGHESFVAEMGADVVYKPTEQWEFRAGPRLFAGDDDYADQYFSDSRVGYEAEGGLLSTGFEVSAGYDFNDTWGVLATATYEQLENDAEDSPIVTADTGSDDQLTISLLVTRAFSFEF